MKHLKTYNKLFEVTAGNKLPDDDKDLILIKDLALDIQDLGYPVQIKGYVAYHTGYDMFDVFIEKKITNEIHDFDESNIDEKMLEVQQSLQSVNELFETTRNFIKRLVENNLYVCSYTIDIKSTNGLWSHIRLARRQDGEKVTNFTYFDGGDD